MRRPESELDRLIPPEIKGDDLFEALRLIAAKPEVRTILDIGASSGEGSSEAFVAGMKTNPSKPQLFCIELSKPRFSELQTRFAKASFVHCYNVGSIASHKFPSAETVTRFYSNVPSVLNQTPLETVLRWLKQDLDYIKSAGVPANGIEVIKNEHGIKMFDVVLIDGSEFTGSPELDELYGARYIILDDIRSFKNYDSFKRLASDPEYSLYEHKPHVRNGFAIFKRNTADNITDIRDSGKVEIRRDEPPLLTILCQGRNDSYLGNFRYRLATALNKHADNIKRLNAKASVEVLVSDWGSEQPLYEVLELSDDARRIVKFVLTPPHITQDYDKDAGFSVPHAINTIARRATGRFLIFCDSDVYVPYESMQNLLKGLRDGKVGEHAAQSSFFWASRHHIPQSFHNNSPTLLEIDAYIASSAHEFTMERVNKSHFSGTGVALLMSHEMWHESTGWDERLIYWGWNDIDWHHRLAKRASWDDLETHGVKVFHLEHYSDRTNYSHELKRKENPQVMPSEFAPNPPNWGLGDRDLAMVDGNGKSVEKKASGKGIPLPTSTRNSLRSESAKHDSSGSDTKVLPIHFFTIVLNGMPFIQHHVEIFATLPLNWHWHIVEGVAALKNDTAWSLKNGGSVPSDSHSGGLSTDGTREYLDSIKLKYPERITVYRTSDGEFWNGKVEMVNAPLSNIHAESLLWQIDVDELWTSRQISDCHEMFRENPDKTAAFYWCWYFVGPDLVVYSADPQKGRNKNWPPDDNWTRTWRYKPGQKWHSHEPPRLCEWSAGGNFRDVAAINPFSQEETEARGLVFQHYAYSLLSQLQFKESYYGYKDAVALWQRLQEQSVLPAKLGDYFWWVKNQFPGDHGLVQKAERLGITPLLRKIVDSSGMISLGGMSHENHIESAVSSALYECNVPEWMPDREKIAHLVFLRPDALGDNVLAASMLPHLRDAFPRARITVVCEDRISDLYKTCPFVDAIVEFNRARAFSNDPAYLQSMLEGLGALQPDICLNAVYSPEPFTHFLARACNAREWVAFAAASENMPPGVSIDLNAIYTRFLPSAKSQITELERHWSFLHGLGIRTPALQPILWLTAEDELYADAFFKAQALKPEKTFALFAGAQGTKKIYTKYGDAIKPFCLGGGWAVVALGADQDFDLNQQNMESLPEIKTINLSGKTTIRQAAAILRRCRLAIGADTGLTHMACAVGTPQVVVLGGGHFGRFFPYSNLTSVACLPLDCYGCNWQCKFSTVHCIAEVSPRVVEEAIRQTLNCKADRTRVFIDAQPKNGTPAKRWPEKMLRRESVQLIEVPSTDSSEMEGDSLSAIASSPKVTLIVITNSNQPEQQHRKPYLRRLLASVSIGGLPTDTEIIVAGSVGAQLEGVTVLELPELAKSGQVCKLRNIAIDRARGEWIIHCDDDVIFCPDYWEAVSANLRHGSDIICTRLLNPNGTRYWDWAAHVPGKGQTLLPYYSTDAHIYATGGHAIYRKSIFEKIKWNEEMRHGQNEEFDLAAQCREAGIRFSMCPSATVFLQYFHCDATAAVTNTTKASKDAICKEFSVAMALIDPTVVIPHSKSKRSHMERLSHKLVQSPKTASRPEISILVACYRYLQRFRVFAQTLCRQDYDLSRVELIVANPQSPDGLSAYLATLKNVCAVTVNGRARGPVIKEVLLDEKYRRNRGRCIQRGFEACTGDIVIGMDCDLALPPGFLKRIAEETRKNPESVVGIYRKFLTPASTESILAGLLDPHRDVDQFAKEDETEPQGYRGVLGYCQAAVRPVWEMVPYPEEFDSIAKSDVAFMERLGAKGIKPLFIQDLSVSHLHHKRDWAGTSDFL